MLFNVSRSHRTLLGASLGAGLFSLCAMPTAHADIHLAIGSRIEPLRYTSAYFPSYSSPPDRPDSLFGSGTSQPFQSTSFSPYLGLFFAQRYGLMVSLDIAYAKSSTETQMMGAPMATDTNNSYFQFGIALGFKMYLNQPRTSKVSPYIYVDLFKYFASVSTDDQSVTGEQAGAQAAMRSPIGATMAFGAEYYLSPSFSLGSEIFGLRISNVSGEYRDAAMTRHDASYTQVAFYTGITLNYRFQIAASVKASDEGADSDAHKQNNGNNYAPPPSPPPPPPSPEAVD